MFTLKAINYSVGLQNTYKILAGLLCNETVHSITSTITVYLRRIKRCTDVVAHPSPVCVSPPNSSSPLTVAMRY